jgi:hypothetical protein
MRLLVGLALLQVACATPQRARAAQALSCPEDQVAVSPAGGPSAGEVALKMVTSAIVTGSRTPEQSLAASAVPSLRAEGQRRWDGCGASVECDAEGCVETEASRQVRLLKLVPQLMEKSRDEVAPGSTPTRTGYFSWELATGSTVIPCRFVMGKGYLCEGAPAATAAPP